MRIVLTGANGQLGWELSRSLMTLGEVIALDRTKANLEDPQALVAIVDTLRPDVIVNAAAYTQVDQAEREEDLATLINGDSVRGLARLANRRGALLVHYSTDYIFDGCKETPYVETDDPSPLNAYGRSKLAGERAIQEECCDYLIFRTTWVYAARGNNFLKTVLRLAAERDELRIIADQNGAPTWSRNISDATAQILVQSMNERRSSRFRSGVFNLAASGATTWYEFARAVVEIARELREDSGLKVRDIVPIKSTEYPLPAVRPKNSLLDMAAVSLRFGVSIPDWRDALKLCISDLYLT